MMRTLGISAFIIVLATSGMLLWQWEVHSKKEALDKESRAKTVQQHFRIQQNDESLRITQTMADVKKGKYTLENPLDAQVKVNGKKVSRNSVVVGKDDEDIVFQYTIPFNANQQSKMLKDWAMKLNNIKTTATRVEMTVEGKRTGSWAAAAEPVGAVKKEYIDYYVFEGEGAGYPLYYQQGDLQNQKVEGGPSIYYEASLEPAVKQVKSAFTEYPALKDCTVILTSKHQEEISKGLLMLKNANDAKDLDAKLADLYADSLFPFQNRHEKWQQEILVDLYNDSSVGGTKAKAMLAVLKEELYEPELHTFIEVAHGEGSPLTTGRLDGILSNIKGKNTSFFTLNQRQQSALVPLYYVDKRELRLNGKPLQKEVYDQDDRLLFPLPALLEAAGYACDSGNPDHILITKGGDALRLYPDKNVFILNGADYSVSSSPITKISGEYYIFNHWLEEIFGAVSVEEEEYISVEIE